jgi:hypothetical protein
MQMPLVTVGGSQFFLQSLTPADAIARRPEDS